MKTGQDYWDELSEESPAGETISEAITVKIWDDCREECEKHMIDKFRGVLEQAKYCTEVLACDGLDDSFLRAGVKDLEKELKEFAENFLTFTNITV